MFQCLTSSTSQCFFLNKIRFGQAETQRQQLSRFNSGGTFDIQDCLPRLLQTTRHRHWSNQTQLEEAHFINSLSTKNLGKIEQVHMLRDLTWCWGWLWLEWYMIHWSYIEVEATSETWYVTKNNKKPVRQIHVYCVGGITSRHWSNTVPESHRDFENCASQSCVKDYRLPDVLVIFSSFQTGYTPNTPCIIQSSADRTVDRGPW